MEYKFNFLCNYVQLKMDLITDLNKIAYDDSVKHGYKVRLSKNSLAENLNIRKRLVSNRKRTIKITKGFNCPDGYEQALDIIKQRISLGKDIKPFLSKKIKTDFSYNDLLLNDWGIQHLHLSEHICGDGFAERSDYELFVYFTDSEAYLIDIRPHKEMNLFCKQELVKRLYENWPSLFKKRLLNGISSNENITDEQIANLRRNGVQMLITSCDGMLAPLGGGYATNGMSMDVTMGADCWHRNLKKIERNIIENIAEIFCSISKLRTNAKPDLDIMFFQGKLGENILLFERTNKVFLNYEYANNGNIRLTAIKKIEVGALYKGFYAIK